ncbi:hypothetical protein TI05_07660 [Achromatium sp. WMS3]|nr:hypothetical protein TI05_07660 [Achromatium sp. WMS3]
MIQTKQLNEIYINLPAIAQQEALDFLLFLQQRYDKNNALINRPVQDKKLNANIRDHLAFGMWSDITEDSRTFLKQLREEQWSS